MSFKKQTIATFLIFITCLSSAQPGFTMMPNQNSPGRSYWKNFEQAWVAVGSLVAAFRAFVDIQKLKLDPPAIIFVSENGRWFVFARDELARLNELSPKLGNMISDFHGSGQSMIQLSGVHDTSLDLLTQLVRRCKTTLLEFANELSTDEFKELDDEAHFLDSQALKHEVEKARNLRTQVHRGLAQEDNLAQRVTWDSLPEDTVTLILLNVDASDRSSMALTCRSQHHVVSNLRAPRNARFFGLIDALARFTVPVGCCLGEPVNHGEHLLTVVAGPGQGFGRTYRVCAINKHSRFSSPLLTTFQNRPLQPVVCHGIVCVFEKVAKRLHLFGLHPDETQVPIVFLERAEHHSLFALDHFIFIVRGDGSMTRVNLDDPSRPLDDFELEGESRQALMIGNGLYLVEKHALRRMERDTCYCSGPVSFGNHEPGTPVLCGGLLWLSSWSEHASDKLVVLAPTSLEVVVERDVDGHLDQLVALDDILYGVDWEQNRLSIIKLCNGIVSVTTKQLSGRPLAPVADDGLLYLSVQSANQNENGWVLVLDPTRDYRVLARIPVGERPNRALICDDILYVTDEKGLNIVKLWSWYNRRS